VVICDDIWPWRLTLRGMLLSFELFTKIDGSTRGLCGLRTLFSLLKCFVFKLFSEVYTSHDANTWIWLDIRCHMSLWPFITLCLTLPQQWWSLWSWIQQLGSILVTYVAVVADHYTTSISYLHWHAVNDIQSLMVVM